MVVVLVTEQPGFPVLHAYKASLGGVGILCSSLSSVAVLVDTVYHVVLLLGFEEDKDFWSRNLGPCAGVWWPQCYGNAD